MGRENRAKFTGIVGCYCVGENSVYITFHSRLYNVFISNLGHSLPFLSLSRSLRTFLELFHALNRMFGVDKIICRGFCLTPAFSYPKAPDKSFFPPEKSILCKHLVHKIYRLPFVLEERKADENQQPFYVFP